MRQEIIAILIAMTPTLEAHGSIITAIGLFKFSSFKAFLLSSIGTVFITAPLLIFWKTISEFLMRRVYIINRFLTWLFSYTRRRHADKFESVDPKEKKSHFIKAVALYIFVAIPGPFTGVWSGTVVAYVFGIPFWYAFMSIVLGALSVSLIDTFAISGFFKLFFGI